MLVCSESVIALLFLSRRLFVTILVCRAWKLARVSSVYRSRRSSVEVARASSVKVARSPRLSSVEVRVSSVEVTVESSLILN